MRASGTMHNCEAGCGQPVSDNKLYCFECEEIRIRSIPAGVADTCTLTRIRSKHVDTLSRDSDGMVIAQRQGAMVLVGDNLRTQKNRLFIDEDSAIRFIRALHPISKELDGENMIVPPNGNMALRN
jgi:hypothetical protein